jgi:hypothetical protein
MFLLCVVTLAFQAAADQAAAAEPAPPAIRADPPPREPPVAPATGVVAAPDKYDSPMRAQCMDELRKDKGWRAGLKGELRLEVHQEEATLIANNKKHVYMAYAALWIIVVIFVVFGWRRQRALRAEIERLQADVAAAVKE